MLIAYNNCEKKKMMPTCAETKTYTRFQKKSVHFAFGDFPLPITLNVHVFGIKIRTCTL